MKQRQRRLCTAFLSVVLIISNILSASMPVYAMSPDAGMDIANTVYADETVSSMAVGGINELPDTFDGVDKTEKSETDENSDSDNGNDTGADSGSGNSDANTDNGDNGNSDINTDNGDTDDSDVDEDNGSSDDSADISDKDDNTGDTDADSGDDTMIDDISNDDEGAVTDNDVEEDGGLEEDAPFPIVPYDDSDYPTEDPQGYDLTNITMTPGSYSADFSAISLGDIYISDGRLRILYTSDEEAAQDFFKGVTKITYSELYESDFKESQFQNWSYDSNVEWDSSLGCWISNVSGSFIGDTYGNSALIPDTTYYYRLVYYNNSNYYFLTVPNQFTTKPALNETSVSIKDIAVEQIGYDKAKVVWVIDNPNQEFLSNVQLSYTDGTEGGQSSYAYAYKYQDENYVTVPNKYYAELELSRAKKAKATLQTYIGDGEKTTIESEEITLTPQDINDAELKLTEKVGTGSLNALIELSPSYSVDRSIQFRLYYRSKSDTSWNTTYGTMYSNNGGSSASVTISVSGLLENTDYEYYIVPTGKLAERTFENLGSQDKPLSFTTKKIVTYEDSEFPDEIFRNYIKQKIGISDSDKITSDKLETLTRLSCQRSSSSGNISSLQGIEYIDNLTSIDFGGHTITDVGGLSSLTGLTEIRLSYNDLTELPDLSGMALLTNAYFDDNRMRADTITEAKLPASWLQKHPSWISTTRNNQRGALKYTLASEYYAIGDTRPFLVKVSELKQDGRKYTLSLTIDGKTVSGETLSWVSGDVYYIKDILKDSSGAETGISVTQGTSYDAVITLTDSYGEEWLNETVSITFAEDVGSQPVVKTQYIRPDASSSSVYIDNLPTTYTKDSIESIVLCDQKGTIVGNASSDSIYIDSSYYNVYEDDFGWFSMSGLTDRQIMQLRATFYFSKYLTAGYYNAVITTTDGESSTYEKTVCVEDMAVLDNLYNSSSYDNYGDYLYVTLSGANLDPTKIRPVFYENDEAITECINGSITGYDRREAVYKLKKLKKDVYWDISGSKDFAYKLQADTGYQFIDNISSKRLTLYAPYDSQGFIVFEHYNYKKGVYEVKTNSTVADGTKVSVSVYNNSSSSRILMGKAESEVTDSILSLTFINEQGESYAPPKDKSAYFQYTYTDKSGNVITFNHENYSVKWYNYSSSGNKSPYNNMVLYHEALLKNLDVNVYIPQESVDAGQDVTMQIYTSSGKAVEDRVILTGKAAANAEYINYTGMWQSAAGLGTGVYQVRYSQSGRNLYSHELYVYDNEKFYMNTQGMGTWSGSTESGVYVSFSSEQLYGNYIHEYNSKVSAAEALNYWKDGGYKLELFDRLGNPISDSEWEIDHASWTGSFYLYLKGLPEEYIGYYVKITKSGSLGIKLVDGKFYYETAYNANIDYGVWTTISRSSIWLNQDTSSATNAYYGLGSYAYPVTVTIMRPYDTDVVQTFTVSAATSGTSYNFTASDLKNIDPKEVYRITVESADGSSRSEVGYLAVRGQNTVVDATGISLDKTTLNLQLNQSEKLAATVKPDNATNKNVTWTTSDASVATVDTQGNVTAIAVGKATITAATHNGKTASCAVQVFNYTLNMTEVSFDLAVWTPEQAVTLKVSNGEADISSSVTWSSNDESVAIVTQTGVVTPEGAGTAKILAEIKDGPILTCNVTVSRDSLTDIKLNETDYTLYLDSKGNPVSEEMPASGILRLYLTPNDATVDSISWESDAEEVVTVDADSDNPLTAVVTAHKKGTAVVSVTVTTKSGAKTAECKITVQTVISEEDIQDNIPMGLTALTNEQLTLGDVELPEGWEWMYPDVALKQFAGSQEKAFAAKYTNPEDSDAIPYERALSVGLSTVTGIAISADSSTLHQGGETNLSIIWNMNGKQQDLSSYAEKVAWSSDKESVVKVNPINGTQTTLTAQGTGKTTVRAKVTFKEGKTYMAQYKVTVVDGEIANIQVTAVDKLAQDTDLLSAYRGKLDSNPDNNNGEIHVTLSGATKLTVKNNNAKVLTTGKAAGANGEYSIPFTIKAAGMTKITLIANDKAKTQKDIYLYVTDVKPYISEDTVTVNLWQTTGTAFTLYPNEGYQVASAQLAGDDASKFTLESLDESPAKYVIKAKEGTAKGNYKLTLQGEVQSGSETFAYDNVAFTVKVVEQAPKYKIKQSAKVNLFYKDWDNSILEITSDESLIGMELTGCDFTVSKQEGTWRLIASENANNAGLTCNKKGTLTLHFNGYKDVQANLMVGVEKKTPKALVDKTSFTLYPTAGLDRARLDPRINDPKGNVFRGMNAVLDQATQDAGFSLMTVNGVLYLRQDKQISKNTTFKAKLTLTDTAWADVITVPLTIKVNMNKPVAKLNKTTLQLNTNAASVEYDMAAAEVMWKDGAAFEPLAVSVSASDNKSRDIINTGVVFAFDKTSNQVVAKLNNTAVAKGSYKFKVNVRVTDTLTVSTPLTVKIVDVAMDKAIKVSAKGSIDVLNREGTFVTVTPTLKSLNGNITAVRLSGRAAHLFDAECADNKVIIHAKSDMALITKYNYKVKLTLTIKNTDGNTIYYTTPEINLKLKQGKPKVAIAPKNATLFSGSYGDVTRSISATLKGAENPRITNVELLNNTDIFGCNYKDGVITLTNTPNAVKGKSYSLQFKVTFDGQADNEKATIVKYSVKVK